MVQIAVDAELWNAVRQHLDLKAERLGFFTADWSPLTRDFTVRDWKPMAEQAAAVGPDELQVSLSDEARMAVIQWAAAEDACLIEVHSHGRRGPAAFSPFDLRNLADWVPHLRWRLRGRPYAAIVTSIHDLDALAWIDAVGEPVQVDGVAADVFFPATRETRSSQRRSNDGREPL